MEIEEAYRKTPQGAAGSTKFAFEIDLDPSWTLAKLHTKVKEDVMQSTYALNSASLIDQMRIYDMDN